MSHAIALSANNDSGKHIVRLWREAGSLEDTPSMGRLGYPPHLTLAVTEGVKADELRQAAHAALGRVDPLRIRFDRIRFFDGVPLVLWASPSDTGKLTALHRALHRHLDPDKCHAYYRPGSWVAHCTLATDIPADKRRDALAFAARAIRPFDLTFDAVDCVRFPPVEITERLWLDARSA